MARKLLVKKKPKKKVATRGPGPFTPWKPGLPPPGTYDPSYDSSIASAQRGNRYLTGDIGGVQGVGEYDSGDLDLQQRRGDEDFTIGLQNIQTSRDRSLADNTRATAGNQRNFDILANRQQSAFRAQGLMGGGVQAALARRQANQAWEQAPIDTARTRTMEDYGNPDTAGDYGTQGRALQLARDRGNEDRTIQAGRAATELNAFEGDARTSAWASAQQNYPYLTQNTRPKNERTVGNQTYQLYRIKGGKRKGQLWKRLPSGKLVPRTDMSTV